MEALNLKQLIGPEAKRSDNEQAGNQGPKLKTCSGQTDRQAAWSHLTWTEDSMREQAAGEDVGGENHNDHDHQSHRESSELQTGRC